jgi:hypothetical protein
VRRENRIMLLVFLLIYMCNIVIAQELPVGVQQQLENITTEQSESGDDSYAQQLLYYAEHPVQLNAADKNELQETGLLNELQIESFLSYRQLLGSIVHIYELQAIPGWDIPTIRRILPYVTIAASLPGREEWRQRFRDGEHSIIFCISQAIDAPARDDRATAADYEGNDLRYYFRYRYSYKNLLQSGILGEKDAGESFLRGAQRTGFDFYSFHLFVRKAGIVQSLAIGHFTVNMGQGLFQWQSMAFGKSADAMAVRRQSPVLRPYSSAGEFNFHRGIGITLQKGKWMPTVFVSIRKLNAGIVQDSIGNNFFSSFQTSGYHRTASEIRNKNTIRQFAWGVNWQYNKESLHGGVSYVAYHYSLPLNRSDEPYKLYSIKGENWYNAGIDYAYTFKNLHFFGEAAFDYRRHRAFLTGMLISADRRVDISFLYRNISKQYQSLYGNAFTENTMPSNERGIYAGIVIRPIDGWRLDAYADIYRFPWLRYQADAPGGGRDFLAQLSYSPNKSTQVIIKFRNESKQMNGSNDTAITTRIIFHSRRNWRMHLESKINANISWRQRTELTWFVADGQRENGFLTCFDFIYRPVQKPVSCIARLQYYETTGYNARIYAYENDVLYSYSIPMFDGKGYRYYILIGYDWKKNFSCWVRWAQTVFEGGMKSEWKVQARYKF